MGFFKCWRSDDGSTRSGREQEQSSGTALIQTSHANALALERSAVSADSDTQSAIHSNRDWDWNKAPSGSAAASSRGAGPNANHANKQNARSGGIRGQQGGKGSNPAQGENQEIPCQAGLLVRMSLSMPSLVHKLIPGPEALRQW